MVEKMLAARLNENISPVILPTFSLSLEIAVSPYGDSPESAIKIK